MPRFAQSLSLQLTWLASLVACSSGVAPLSPGLRRELTVYDYAAYSAWLATQRSRPGMVLVDDRTTSSSYGGLSEIVRPAVTRVSGGCGAEPGVIATPPGVVPPPPVVTSAPVPADLLRQAGLIVAFSRVGFDSRLEVATFQALLAPVHGGWATDAAEYRVWVERTGTRWELVEVELTEPVAVNVGPGVATPADMTCDSTHTADCVRPPTPVPVPLPLPRPR